jgi:transcriptional regulator of acetoin/glycerol metabolism
LTEEDYLELTGGQSRSAFERAEVRCDVEAFLRQLPEELRQLAETLQAHNVDSLAAHLGLSRATAYRRLQALRQAAQKFFSESENI